QFVISYSIPLVDDGYCFRTTMRLLRDQLMGEFLLWQFDLRRIEFDENLSAFGVGEHFQSADLREWIGYDVFQQGMKVPDERSNVGRAKQFGVVVEFYDQPIRSSRVRELDFKTIDTGKLFENRK